MKIVFTNGCFDLLHRGHIDLLSRARNLGDRLVVGINSDESVRKIKGPERPLVDEHSRKLVLEALRSVDEVVIFDELTPQRLIGELRPDVLVKGGDWNEDEIVGADVVRANGGVVVSLPLVDGFSTSSIIEKMRVERTPDPNEIEPGSGMFDVHKEIFTKVSKDLASEIERAALRIVSTIMTGGKIMACGNGVGAAIAQGFASKLLASGTVSKPAAAIALTTDTSALTALANDYAYERVFARQIEALGLPGDCLLLIDTDGCGSSVIAAAMTGRETGCKVVALTGSKGKKLAALSDISIMVPSEDPGIVEGLHLMIGHIISESVSNQLDALN